MKPKLIGKNAITIKDWGLGDLNSLIRERLAESIKASLADSEESPVDIFIPRADPSTLAVELRLFSDIATDNVPRLQIRLSDLFSDFLDYEDDEDAVKKLRRVLTKAVSDIDRWQSTT